MASRRSIPPPAAFLENKLVSQAAEIERLSGDNHKLTSAHVALRQDLVDARQDVEKLREHVRSLQTEGDIEIRIMLDKIAKMEADIRAGERVKKDLQQAHLEARSLETAKHELTVQIQQATQELEKARDDVKKLPEMNAELDSSRQEHQKLRKTFEHEKGLNIEKVEQMKIMEKELIGMAGEVERLRAEVSNAEKRAQAPSPYAGPYVNPDPSYPRPTNGNGGYMDGYGRPHYMVGGTVGEGMVPYGGGSLPAPAVVGAAPLNGGIGGSSLSWGASHTLR